MQHKNIGGTGCVEVPIAERVLLETLKHIDAELIVGKFNVYERVFKI